MIGPFQRLLSLYWLTVFSCIGLCAVLVVSAMAQGAASARYELGGELEFIEDPQGTITITDLLNNPTMMSHWIRPGNLVPNLGFSPSHYWVRVELDPEFYGRGDKIFELAYPLMDELEFYYPDSSGQYRRSSTGDSLPFSQRVLPHKYFAFPLVLAEKPVAIYLHVASRDTLIFPVTLWDTDAFRQHYDLERYVLGAYYGAMLSILLYNLMVFLSLRDPIYIYYVLLIASYSVTQLSLNGIGFEVLWQDAPEFAKRIRPFSVALIASLAIGLTLRYFNRKKLVPDWPGLIPSLYGVSSMAIVGAIVLPFTWAIQLAMVAMVLSCFTALITGVLEWKRNGGAALYFVLGWSLLIVAGIANVLRAFGILPVNFFTVYGTQLGSISTLLLLTFGLSDRLNALQREKEKAQAAVLEQQKEAVHTLDTKVKERTAALEMSHRIISRKSESFKLLLETSSLLDHRESLQSLLELAVSQLARVFPEQKFALILDEYALEEPIKPIYRGIEQSQKEYIQRYHDHLMEQNRDVGAKLAAEADSQLLNNLNLIPVRLNNKKLLGHLILLGSDIEFQEREPLLVFVEQISVFLQNKLLHDQLDTIANKDSLTGVYSRAFFDRYYTNLIKTKQKNPAQDFSLILIDLNGLKRMNDEFGHEAGDQMITVVARFLKENCRGNDVVARLGGDEFVIAAKEKQDHAQMLAQKLEKRAAALEMKCTTEAGEQITVPLSFSMGLASSDTIPPKNVLKAADHAMYERKRQFYAQRGEKPR